MQRKQKITTTSISTQLWCRATAFLHAVTQGIPENTLTIGVVVYLATLGFVLPIVAPKAAATTVAQTQTALPSEKIAGSSAIPSIPETGQLNAQKDARVAKLRAFLLARHSPMADSAQTFITEADRHGIDWRWVPAIAGVESSFGNAIPVGSYNAYGWANGAYRFQSWDHSIAIVTKALKENYVNRGAETIFEIAPIYAPPSKTWAGKVNFFIAQIDQFNSSSTEDLALAH